MKITHGRPSPTAARLQRSTGCVLSRSMPVRVMHVRNMRMPVTQPHMPVAMRVRFAGRVIRIMRVLMVLVMHMRVTVLHRLVCMLVFVMLGQM